MNLKFAQLFIQGLIFFVFISMMFLGIIFHGWWTNHNVAPLEYGLPLVPVAMQVSV